MIRPLIACRRLGVWAWLVLGLVFGLGAQPARAGSYEDFFTAVKRDDVGTMQQLHQRGFDLNTVDAYGRTALHMALRDSAPKVAEYLIGNTTVQVEVRTPQDESPLMFAVLKGQLTLAKALLARGADVNKPGWTPLHYAAAYAGPKAAEQVTLLLENHAYIDAESPNRSTPLMLAAQYGLQDVVALLLDEGADTSVVNEQALTAMDFALRAQRPAIAELIASKVRSAQPKGRW